MRAVLILILLIASAIRLVLLPQDEAVHLLGTIGLFLLASFAAIACLPVVDTACRWWSRHSRM